MRLHEVVEACVEYVAMDGVLGSEPRVLQQYLRTLDPGIDEDFFVFIWPSLIEHPLLQVIITAYPIHHSDGSVNLGSAPLPANYQSQVPHTAPRHESGNGEVEPIGLKGRALAFALEGKDYKTDKETINENRKAKAAKARERQLKRAGASQKEEEEDNDEENAARDRIFRLANEDDGGEGDDRVLTSDISQLYPKWGSRLRIRATDDEIYFRLTGSHRRIGKITPIVFHALQLCARSRERGITALELGPAIDSSQGSVHHFMKTLIQLGLCTKVPIVLHSSVTNLLIFHRFLHLNEHYRAVSRLPPLGSGPSHTSTPAAKGLSASEAADDPMMTADQEEEKDDSDDEEDGDVDGEDLTRPDTAWNLDLTPVSEEQLMAGHVVKDRLLRILDHPNLKNHLLKRKNLLRVVGWNGPYVLRHKRAIPRVINALIHDGLVESIEVGVKRIACLRLTKYNPDYTPPVAVNEDVLEVDEGPHLLTDADITEENAVPYLHQGNTKATELLDYQVVRLAELSGSDGLTIAEIRHSLDEYYKRNIETQFKRAEDGYVPPHLRNRQIVHSMDTQGKERRLKALTLPAYRLYMSQHGLPVDDSKYPPITDEIGRWGSLEPKSLWSNPLEVNRILSSIVKGDPKAPAGKVGRPPKGSAAKRKRATQDANIADAGPGQSERDESEDPSRSSPALKMAKYTAQTRGRPRQYIHVVNPQGKVDRRIIGQIRPRPDLAPIWIYVPDDEMLYPADPGYNGLGAPPPISDEAKSDGKPPSFFRELGTADETPTPAGKGKKKKGATSAKGKKSVAEGEDSEPKVEGTAEQDLRSPAEHTVSAGQNEDARDPPGATPSDMPAAVVTAPSTADFAAAAQALPATTGKAQESQSEDMIPFTPETAVKKGKKLGRPSKNTFLYPPASLAYQSPVAPTIGSPASTSTLPTTVGPEYHPPSHADSTADQSSMLHSHIASSQKADEGTSLFPKRKHPMYGRPSQSSRIPDKPKNLPDDTVAGDANPPDDRTAAEIFAEMQGHRPKEKDKRIRSPQSSATDVAMPAAASPFNDVAELLPRKRARRGKASLPQSNAEEQSDQVRGDIELALDSLSSQDIGVDQPKNDGAVPPDGSSKTSMSSGELSVGHESARPRATTAQMPSTPSGKGRSLLVSAAQGETSSRSRISSGLAPAASPLQIQSDIQAPPTVTAPSNEQTTRLGTPGGTRVELTHSTSGSRPNTGVRSRIDMGSIRRSNELYHAIKDEGKGICETVRVPHIQFAYAKRIAGTDAPGANQVATQMDRTIVNRHIGQMVSEGRLKQTKVTIHTTTGKRKDVELVYLPEVSQQDLKQYALTLSERLASAYIVKRQPQRQVAEMEYTEVKVPATMHRSGQSQPMVETTLAYNKQTLMADVEHLTPEMRRSALLSDLRIVHALYGYYNGKNARMRTLHSAIVNLFSTNTDAAGIVSTTPRIFSLDMLFTELTVSEWFHCVPYVRYSEKLEAFVRDPATKDTKIGDVPAEVRPKGCFKGHSAKQKFTSLFRDMADLKLLIPLVSVQPEEAEMIFDTRDDNRVGFSVTDNFTSAVYYRLYDYAPVYHIASDALSLQGILPVRTAAEADRYWTTLQTASLETDINAIPALEHSVTDKTLHASLADHLEIDDIEKIKMLRSRIRWKADSRLVDVQSRAVDSLFDRDDGTLLVNDDEKLKEFAWEWAIQFPTLKEQINARLARMSRQGQIRQQKQRQTQEKAADAERRKQRENELTARLKEIRESFKREQEERVRAAAERTGIPYSPALENYMVNMSLQSLRVGNLTDDEMDSACRLFVRQQENPSGASSERPLKSQMKFNPLSKRTMRKQPARPNVTAKKVKKADHRSGPRRRRKWTEDDDARLLYAEAIVRARHKANGKKIPGRHAMTDLFPDASLQVCLNRLKSLWRQPGKQAFYERLMETYLELWPKHRGTDVLPDEDPSNVNEFELEAHIAFLMERVPPEGLLNMSVSMVPFEVKIEDLPADLEALLHNKAWNYASVPTSSWDAIYELPHDEQRNIITSSIPEVDESIPPSPVGPEDHHKGKLMSLLKIITGTDIEDYSDAVVRALIESEAPANLKYAVDRLVDQKVIIKWRGASDGRMYMVYQPWIVASDGIFTEELLFEADSLHSRFEKKADKDGKVEWPLVGPEGEMAALMNMVSNHQVDFDLDPETFPTLKAGGYQYNTRKLNDVDLEYPLKVHRVIPLIPRHSPPPMPDIYHPVKPQAWRLEETTNEAAVRTALQAIKDAGAKGLTRSSLAALLKMKEDAVLPVLAALSVYDVFWAGYDTARVVHKDYWEKLTIEYHDVVRDAAGQALRPSPGPGVRAAPRVWTDIFGKVVPGLWERAKRNVLGYIIARPGASERYLRNKIGTTLDRLEVNEVLQWLLDAQMVERRRMKDEILPPIEAVDVSDEEKIAWYPVSGILWQ